MLESRYPSEKLFNPYKNFFLTFFECDANGYPVRNDDGSAYNFDIPETFPNVSSATAKAREITKKIRARAIEEYKEHCREEKIPCNIHNPFFDAESHSLAVVKNGDDWGFVIAACVLDGKLANNIMDDKEIYKAILKLS